MPIQKWAFAHGSIYDREVGREIKNPLNVVKRFLGSHFLIINSN